MSNLFSFCCIDKCNWYVKWIILSKYVDDIMNNKICIIMCCFYGNKFYSILFYSQQTTYSYMSNVGSVVECSPATRAARVRFPDVAIYIFLLHFHNSLVLNLLHFECLYSSVAEHLCCKPGGESSILWRFNCCYSFRIKYATRTCAALVEF